MSGRDTNPAPPAPAPGQDDENQAPTVGAVTGPTRPRDVSVPAVLLFAVLTAAALTWAKWWPYAHKVPSVLADHVVGTSVLADDGGDVPSPSLRAGLDYAVRYFASVWVALVAALAVAAAVETFLPRRWLLRALRQSRRDGDVVKAGLLSTVSMMCSCCAAPVASSLRRQGVSTPATLAYWVGNPTLNPAVVIFLAAVLPWEWVAVRVLVGALLVFVVTAAVGRLAVRRGEAWEASLPPDAWDCGPAGPPSLRYGAVRFVRTAGRLARRILPEYVAVVFVLGALRGWLFAASDHAGHAPLLTALVLAVAGTLFPIATAGEIPIVSGLMAAGLAPALAATLLMTLPAVNLPSILMMRRDVSWRPLGTVVAAVVGAGLVAGGLIGVLV